MKREELKFEDWGAIWLNYKKEFVKESTYANYLTAMANQYSGISGNENRRNLKSGHSKNNTDVVEIRSKKPVRRTGSKDDQGYGCDFKNVPERL